MTRNSEYSEKLKDPRWQKKRLLILERDGWVCSLCGNEKETLHVHHKLYKNGEPWEIPNDALQTLCASCHKRETETLPEAIRSVTASLKLNFNAEEIEHIAYMLNRRGSVDNLKHRNAKADIIGHMLFSRECFDMVENHYFNHLKSKISEESAKDK